MGANLILLILLSAFKTQEFSFIWVKFLVLVAQLADVE